MAPSLPCGSQLPVYDFVPGNYESLNDLGGGVGQRKTVVRGGISQQNSAADTATGKDKLVVVEGEESEIRPRFEHLLG
jgi:hypothetical protein